MTVSPNHTPTMQANTEALKNSASHSTIANALIENWDIKVGPANIFAQAMVGERDQALDIIAGRFTPTAANDNIKTSDSAVA